MKKDLDKLLDDHPMICYLPKSEEEKTDLSKIAPENKRYVYVVMDSGASLHAADLENHFPGNVLELTDGSRRGESACTANGHKLYNLCKFEVHRSCNGVKVSLGFTNMKVDVPVCSVRTFVRTGNEVEFFEGGGVVRNSENDALLPFVEMGGVYFLQLKIKTPKNSHEPNKSFFVWQGH